MSFRLSFLLPSLAFFATTALAAPPRSPVVPLRESPAQLERLGDGRLFLDFGTDSFGTLELTVPTGAAPSKVVVHLGEALSGAQTLDRRPGGTVRYQRHEVVLRPGATVRPDLTWNPPGWMKKEWLEPPAGVPQVMPFRYVEIEHAPPELTAAQVRRISWSVPFAADASAFDSSSAELNAVWQLCRHTIQATSFLGLYVDGDRERKPYEADVLINQLGHYCLDARYDTARLSHEYLLERPTWPTEWRLQAVILAWHDFLWSGDDRSLRHHYATLKSRAMLERRTPDGLFRGWNEGEIKDIVDWPAGERDGYDMKPEVKTVVTAFHYRALILLEKIAHHLGKEADAKEFAALAQVTRERFNEALWDEGRGCYLDGLDPASGRRSDHASAHANFFPLALGLIPEERRARVAAFLKPRGMACSVYGAQFLLEGLFEAGEADAALALLTSRGRRSWLNMSEKVGATMALEAWDPSLKPNLDWNHAWGAAPANLIPRGLMGIEPLEPGFRRFRVRPQTAGLSQAKIKLPTPRGAILLDIRRDAVRWQAELTVPAGAVAEFQLPLPGQPQVAEAAGASATPLPARNGRAVLGLGAGSWQLALPAS